MGIKSFLVISILFSYSMAKAVDPDAIINDTAVVRSYNRIPVFYHCTPLHRYKVLGMMKRTALVSYCSQAFEKYTMAARHKQKTWDIGILIDDMSSGVDSFSIVRFDSDDGRADTAVFSTPIFLSARPTKPYKVIRVLNDNFSYGSLNCNLQRYLNDAACLHIKYDGIMLRDINYTFRKDAIFVFRWL